MTERRLLIERIGSAVARIAAVSACLACSGLGVSEVAAQIYVDGESAVVIAGSAKDAAIGDGVERTEVSGGGDAERIDDSDDIAHDALLRPEETAATAAEADSSDSSAAARRGYGAAALGCAPATSARIITRATAAPGAMTMARRGSIRSGDAWTIDPWYAKRYHVSWGDGYGRVYSRRYRSPGYIVGYGFAGAGWCRPIGFHDGFLWNFPGCVSWRSRNVVHCR